MEAFRYDNTDLIIESAASIVDSDYNFDLNDFEESTRAYYVTLEISMQVLQPKDCIALEVILPQSN